MAKRENNKPVSIKKGQAKKKRSAKKIIITAAVLCVIAAGIVLLVINAYADKAKQVLNNTSWISQTAHNASGDEVDVREVYNVKYSQYQGRLTFDGENGFELWLSPGDASDGTHSGKYELKDDKLYATFDEGTKTEFELIRKDGKITEIDIRYNDYTVGFYQEK